MSSYSDKYLNVKDHRLTYLDHGFQIPALSFLILDKSSIYKYQEMTVLNKLMREIQESSSQVSIFCNVVSLSSLPLFFSYLLKGIGNIHFYMSSAPRHITINKLTMDLAEKVINYVSDDLNSLYAHLLDGAEKSKYVVMNSEDSELIKRAIIDLYDKRLSAVYIHNYGRIGTENLYFFAQSMDLMIEETACGLGVLRR